MAKKDVTGYLVNARPLDLAIRLGNLGELLNRRTVSLDRRVARHAFRCRGEGHHLAGIGVDVAHLALQLEISRMDLMAERDRLRRRLIRRLGENVQSAS